MDISGSIQVYENGSQFLLYLDAIQSLYLTLIGSRGNGKF